MTPVGKHECDYLKERKVDYEIVKYWDEEYWMLIDYSSFDDAVPHITIIYCPYCGKRLETQKEKWERERDNIGQE